MARGQNLGPRSRVDPAGRSNRKPFGSTNRKPCTDVPRAGSYPARMTKATSPTGLLQRRGRRTGRRSRRR